MSIVWKTFWNFLNLPSGVTVAQHMVQHSQNAATWMHRFSCAFLRSGHERCYKNPSRPFSPVDPKAFPGQMEEVISSFKNVSNAGSFPSRVYSEKDSASICNVTVLVTTERLWVQLRGKQLVGHEVSQLFATKAQHSACIERKRRYWVNHSHPVVEADWTMDWDLEVPISAIGNRQSAICNRQSAIGNWGETIETIEVPKPQYPKYAWATLVQTKISLWLDFGYARTSGLVSPKSCRNPNRICQESNTSPSKNIFDFVSDGCTHLHLWLHKNWGAHISTILQNFLQDTITSLYKSVNLRSPARVKMWFTGPWSPVQSCWSLIVSQGDDGMVWLLGKIRRSLGQPSSTNGQVPTHT